MRLSITITKSKKPSFRYRSTYPTKYDAVQSHIPFSEKLKKKHGLCNMDNIQTAMIELARQNSDIVIVWLYGSRVKGLANINSDFDVAVAFKSFIKNDALEKRLRPECLALDWQQALGLQDFKLSIVDINQAPIPLAWQIIEPDCVLYCSDERRLWQETRRIGSRMEIDFTPPVHEYPLQLWS